jgi:hypothetical protein
MPLPKSIGLPPLQLKLESIPGFIIPCIGPNPLPLPAIATWSNQSDGRLRQHVNKIQTKLIIPRCRTHALRKVNHKLMINKKLYIALDLCPTSGCTPIKTGFKTPSEP